MRVKCAFFVLILAGCLGCSVELPKLQTKSYPEFVTLIQEAIEEECNVDDCFVREVVYEEPSKGEELRIAFATVTHTNNGFKTTYRYAFIFTDGKITTIERTEDSQYDFTKQRGKTIDLD